MRCEAVIWKTGFASHQCPNQAEPGERYCRVCLDSTEDWAEDAYPELRFEDDSDPLPRDPNAPNQDDEVIWCEVCQDYIKRSELRFWNGDDAHHWLCPGCDSDLLPVTSPDQEYDEWRREQGLINASL